MEQKAHIPKINSRSLARLISNAGFRKMDSIRGAKTYSRQLKVVLEKGGTVLPTVCSLADLLDLSYIHLQNDYRHEYIYKTKLLSEFILEKYSLSDTIILNEFKIGKSIADMILVNGTNKVFEIKTELDSPERLKTQINDYYKAFSEVYIVTHHTLTSKYRSLVDESVGIIEFNSEFKLETIREAVINQTMLDNLAMMKSLRKGEFLQIIEEIYSCLPQTSQVKMYKECLDLAKQVSPTLLQQKYLSTIKSRINPIQELVLKSEIPVYLKFFCYLSNFSENQYIALPSRLSCVV